MTEQDDSFDPWSLDALQQSPAPDDGPLLSIDTIEGIEPLDMQMGVWPPKAVPNVLYEPLFGQTDPTEAEIAAAAGGNPEDVPPMRTYAILDAAKVFGLAEMLDASGLKHRCLFKGEAYDDLKDVAPWIVRLKEDNDFTRNLFTAGNAPWYLWDKGPGIYIRSRASFKTIWQHFRKFVHLQDHDNKWLYFRFWEPEVFLPYLQGVAKRSDRTGRLLQTAKHDSLEIIIIDHLQTATHFKLVHPVPNRPGGPMVLDRHDLAIIKNIAWHAFSRELGQWISKSNPDRFATFSKTQLQTLSRHVITQGRRFGCVNKEDFVYLAHMMMTLGGWFYLSGHPSPLIALLQDDEPTTQRRLEQIFLPAYERLPMAQLTRDWADVTTFIQSIPQDEQIKRAHFRTFSARFLPNHHAVVENLIARMSHHPFFHELEPEDQGKYLILALGFGERFEIDPLRPWAGLSELEAINMAWQAAFIEKDS